MLNTPTVIEGAAAFLRACGSRCAIGALCIAGLAQGVQAQSAVRGVIADLSGRAIEGVHVTIGDQKLAAETNAAGEFAFRSVSVGLQTMVLRRLGYRPDTQKVNVTQGRSVGLRAVMTAISIELAPVLVTGRREIGGPLAGFYARRLSGSGRFFTSEDIEKRNPSHLTDMLRSVPGFAVSSRSARSSVRIRGSRCAPVIFLDGQGLSGVEFDLDAVAPSTIAALELYSGSSSVPVEFQRDSRVSSNCGTILIWTKRGEPSSRRNASKGLTPAALIDRMMITGTVVTASEVDTAARLDSSRLVVPVYPQSMFESATGGRVVAEFVVAADGEVDMLTFSAVTSTHPAFVDAVRDALDRQHFFPAWQHGKTVHQVMHLPFEFVGDSTVLKGKRR